MIEDNNATYAQLLQYYEPNKIQTHEYFENIKTLRDQLLYKDVLTYHQDKLLDLLTVLIYNYEDRLDKSKMKLVQLYENGLLPHNVLDLL